jgi:uncharacterized RDD family membrane protein YckC
MTDPAGGTPPQGSGNWQSGAGGGGGFQSAPIATGPAPGVSYADLVTRIIALIIDGLVLGIPYGIVMFVLLFAGNWAAFVLGGLLYFVASAAYFVYTWTTMRASPGQKILSLQTVNAADGGTLTRDQAIRRWAFLWGPAAVAQVFSYGGGFLGLVGFLVSLAAIGYEIYLLYTASQSPKRQGFHDVQAATVVVKVG